MVISFKQTALAAVVLSSLFSSTVFADTNPSTQASPAATMPSVENPAPDMGKISYILGYQMGGAAESQGVNLQADAFSDGVKAGVEGTPSKYSDEESKAAMDAFQHYMENKMMDKQNQMADQNQKASNDFMLKIAQEPGVTKITDGLYYKVLTAGTGAIPTAKDKVKVNYEGSLIDGTVFDSSYKRGAPISFGVNQVISGWTQALQKMPVGSTWMVYISPELAYGKFAPPVIGPNQALVFKIELIGINQ
jgi:FKBP-type peptidyl-prolyl cis-trans isomerase FklB